MFKRIMVIELEGGKTLEYGYRGKSKQKYLSQIAFLNQYHYKYKTYDKLVLKSYKIA